MTSPSEHTSWREFGCKDGTPYPDEWRVGRALVLARAFEAIRADCGDKAIKILSAYRTPAHNARVGGTRASQHKEGRALDLRPPDGLTVYDFHARIKALATARPDLMIRGIGLYTSFIHVDVRPGERIAFWSGTRQAAEVPK